MAHKPSKEIRPMLLHAHFPSLLPKQSVQSHHDQAIMCWAENTDKLPPEQSGFRKHLAKWLTLRMLHMNAPALQLRWISSFLSDRVKVRILGHTSKETATMVFPQGSPISPLLFLLYMSKLPKLLPNTRRSLFADDF